MKSSVTFENSDERIPSPLKSLTSMVDKFVRRFSRITNLKGVTLHIHLEKYHSEQSRIKYSIRTKLFARKLNMSVSDSGWNFGKVLPEIFDNYEKNKKIDFL